MLNTRYSLQLVAHSVDLLDVGEDHLGVDPPLLHHAGHVLRRQEVRHARELLAGGEGQLEVFPPVRGRLCPQRFVVECIGEEVVDKSTESSAVSPRLGEVLQWRNNFKLLIVSCIEGTYK